MRFLFDVQICANELLNNVDSFLGNGVELKYSAWIVIYKNRSTWIKFYSYKYHYAPVNMTLTLYIGSNCDFEIKIKLMGVEILCGWLENQPTTQNNQP